MLFFLTIVCYYQLLLIQPKKLILKTNGSAFMDSINIDWNNLFSFDKSILPAAEDTINSRFFNYASRFIINQPYPGAKTYNDYTILRLDLKPLENAKSLRPDFGPVINDVTAIKYLIDVPKCRHETTANRTLFIGILSAPIYFDKRKQLRETWLSILKDSLYHQGLLDVIGYFFILGQTANATVQSEIEKESRDHGDVLQVDIIDSYNNLTRKSVSLLNWVNSKCSHVDFVLKVDDDTYTNVYNLANILNNLSPNEMSVYGEQNGNHDNIRRSPRASNRSLHRDLFLIIFILI